MLAMVMISRTYLLKAANKATTSVEINELTPVVV